MESYRGLWEISVLALLREAPMHPYQMARLLRERHKDELLVLKRGSLYHAINRLMTGGLIEASDVGRSGRRPERTTYRITAEGRKELIRVIRQMVGTPKHESSEFMAAMSFLLHLDHKDAIALLEDRVRRLESEIQTRQSGMTVAREHVDRINLIESEYLLAMRHAELKWVREVIGELRARRLQWDIKKIFREAEAERKGSAGAQEKKR